MKWLSVVIVTHDRVLELQPMLALDGPPA